jgi:hypothetical protein
MNTKNDLPTYEELAQRVSELSDALYDVSFDLARHYEVNMVPGEKPMNICFIAKETLRNMSYTLETIADVMLGN